MIRCPNSHTIDPECGVPLAKVLHHGGLHVLLDSIAGRTESARALHVYCWLRPMRCSSSLLSFICHFGVLASLQTTYLSFLLSFRSLYFPSYSVLTLRSEISRTLCSIVRCAGLCFKRSPRWFTISLSSHLHRWKGGTGAIECDQHFGISGGS